MNYLFLLNIINLVNVGSTNVLKKMFNNSTNHHECMPDDLKFFKLGELLMKILFSNNYIKYWFCSNSQLVFLKRNEIVIKFIDKNDVKLIYNECLNKPSDIFNIKIIKKFIKPITIIETSEKLELFNLILKNLFRNFTNLVPIIHKYRIHRYNDEFYEKAALAVILEKYPKLFRDDKDFFEGLISVIRDDVNCDDVFPDVFLKNNLTNSFLQQEKEQFEDIESLKGFIEKLKKEYLSIINKSKTLPPTINRKKILNEVDIQRLNDIIQEYFSNKTKKKSESNITSYARFSVLIQALFQNYTPFYYLINQLNVNYD
ncbi:hypothetical protein HERIO_574 [Hepatospora eriocheir]|uniref:Uncharacterized protein n=1 Tax=Hepatospora eriocheir TaxID=1081669 RepID=A0A1X0QCT6_9MICR|nr:hypothetical protein HERIO_574 [Hepatospora eriocheir]